MLKFGKCKVFTHFSQIMLSLRCTFWVLLLVVTSVLAARMSGDDHLTPWSVLSGVDILSAQHHLCQDLASEIFMNLWNNTESLSLRLVLLTINVVQDIYCKFSRYPWSLYVCTKFDNVFIWWKVSGMFLFHDPRSKQSIKLNRRFILDGSGTVGSIDSGHPSSQLALDIFLSLTIFPSSGDPWGASQQSWQLMQPTLISPGSRETVREERKTKLSFITIQ